MVIPAKGNIKDGQDISSLIGLSSLIILDFQGWDEFRFDFLSDHKFMQQTKGEVTTKRM